MNGVCLTVVAFDAHSFDADVSTVTLARTTLGAWTVGRLVNLEKSLRFGDRVGGHLVSGHVDGVGQVVSIEADARATRWRFALPRALSRFVAEKGSIAVDGVSLTVNSVGDEHFSRKSQAKMNEFRRSGKTIVLVTHDLGTVQNWCDAAAWIDGARIRMYGRSEDVVREDRRAVAAAEAEGEKTGHSALSQPGLALPETGPVVEEKAANATVTAVRLRDGAGASPEAFSPGAPLAVEIDWKVAAKGKTRFTLDLMSADGRLVFSTGWDGDVLEGAGTAKLQLARLGLGGGVYEVLVSASTDGELVKNPSRHPLHVAPTEGVGLLRPELHWSL